MPSHRRSLLTAACVLGTCVLLLGFQQPPEKAARGIQTLRAEGELKWARGNIHTHSLWSDGDDYPEMIARWYKQHGYQFLCFTDHNVLHNTQRWTDVLKNKGGQRAYDKLKEAFPGEWVEERTEDGRLQVRLKTLDEVSEKLAEPGEYLLIQGEEISDRFQRYPIHLNATNISEAIPPLHGDSVYETIQNNVNAVIAQRERTGQPMLIHLNHPNFGYAVRAEDLMRVRGENFFEVYNGHPGVRNSGNASHASTERIWDIILTQRIVKLDLPLMYGLATDDGHNYHNIPSRSSNPGRGWVMVLTDALTPTALISALEAGRFYSTSGVELAAVTTSEAGMDIEVTAKEGESFRIDFIGTRKGFDPESRPVLDDDGNEVHTTRIYSDDIGRVLKTVEGAEASYMFTPDDLYVRAVVTSSRKHPNPSEPGEFERAWVQPLKGPAAR